MLFYLRVFYTTGLLFKAFYTISDIATKETFSQTLIAKEVIPCQYPGSPHSWCQCDNRIRLLYQAMLSDFQSLVESPLAHRLMQNLSQLLRL